MATATKTASTTNIVIRSDERVFLCGKTRSGKTYAANALLWPARRLVVIDSKDALHDWRLEDYKRDHDRKIRDPRTSVRIRIVQQADALDVLEKVYAEGNMIVYIDEASSFIGEQQVRAPQIIADIWRRGGSRNIGGWATDQRPSGLPRLFMSEAEHIFVFRLQLLDDRRRVAEFAGPNVLEVPTDKHGFWYYTGDLDEAAYWPRIGVSPNGVTRPSPNGNG